MARIIVAITGATGSIYGVRLLEELGRAGVETHLIVSDAARTTIDLETDFSLREVEERAVHRYANGDIAAPPASGSFLHQGMAVAPCSMKTLSAIANGYSDNLISRSADVTIKEGRKLILLARETPLSPVHLENMLKLARIGVVIMPPAPAFYNRPRTIGDIVDQSVGRVLDQLGIENSLVKRWPGE